MAGTHLEPFENMFGTENVRANECYSMRKVKRHNRNSFSIFFNIKVCLCT